MRSPAAPLLRRIVAGWIVASLAILPLTACTPNAAGVAPAPAPKGAAKETVAPGP
ncbi:MAG: hypothetical protein IMX05_09240, partial [Hydrogenibacillus schlegelii]|nr:hypothetical protein [Hydrogenibacillus schlegelii]